MAYIYPFRMTSTTATMLLIDPVAREVIIGVRSDDAWVFPGADSLPGGFMEARWTKEHEEGLLGKLSDLLSSAAQAVLGWVIGDADRYNDGEDSVACAVREVREELCIEVAPEQFKLFDVRANARTDTRAHVTNVCYYAEITPEQNAAIEAGDDLKAIKRWKIDDFFLEMPMAVIEAQHPMAFNHFELMIAGLLAWQKDVHYNELLAEVITLRTDNANLRAKNADLRWSSDAANGLTNWGA